MQGQLNRFKETVRDAIPLAYLVRGYLEPEIQTLPYLARKGELVLDVDGNRGRQRESFL